MKLILSLITLLLVTNGYGQARAPKPKSTATTYYYYGVQKVTGTLQLLGSSADPNYLSKTFGKDGPGTSATELFNFAVVYRSKAKLTAASLIWRDDHGQPGVRWNQHVEMPAGPPLPVHGWLGSTNLLSSPTPPLPEAPAGGADTQAPVFGAFALDCNITNFPTHVLFAATYTHLPPGQGYWTDPESGQSTRAIFDIRFPIASNSFYTAWTSHNLTDWLEYPTPITLHPARVNSTNEMYFPILTNGHNFFTLRSLNGGTRTWQ